MGAVHDGYRADDTAEAQAEIETRGSRNSPALVSEEVDQQRDPGEEKVLNVDFDRDLNHCLTALHKIAPARPVTATRSILFAPWLALARVYAAS